MKKAVLDLNVFKAKNRTNEELVEFFNDWKTIPSINLWLKARHFDVSRPIMVTQDGDLILTFFQKAETETAVIVVHPNPVILEQLVAALKEPGRIIHSFKKVKAANEFIQEMTQNKKEIHNIVVPTNLEVSYGFNYKSFLNKKYPKYNVITIDNKDYRDSINLRTFKVGV